VGSIIYKKAFFLGIGGIGMSALARFYKAQGCHVCGYDKTPSPLTLKLQEEGIEVFFEDSINHLPDNYLKNSQEVLWVYTPAIPLQSVIRNIPGLTWQKRSEVLGLISKETHCLAVAGTHGKTTTSVLLAHILNESNINFTAFLGGISSNLGSNYFTKTNGIELFNKPITIMEADEYDRSFHRLSPYKAIITSSDPDHLDIYKSEAAFEEAFEQFAQSVEKEVFAAKKVSIPLPAGSMQYGTAGDTAIYPDISTQRDGRMVFTYHSPSISIENIEMGVPGLHNLENTLAAMSLALSIGADPSLVKQAIQNFTGVKRRFEIIVKTESHVVIDDYAHHPHELESFISAVKGIYPGRKITGIFQPHLFSRTQDFADGFAQSLDLLDELFLMDIYPAREEPIPGVSSNWLLQKVSISNKGVYSPNEVLAQVNKTKPNLLLIMGAGDIDRLVPKIKEIYEMA
jgi:UDP-N-acetylmuramate--alanine ligase